MSKMLDDDETMIAGTIIKKKDILLAPVVIFVCIFGLAIWIYTPRAMSPPLREIMKPSRDRSRGR